MKNWDSLGTRQKIRKVNRAKIDPLFFAKDPYFLGVDLYPVQKYVVKSFYDLHRQGKIDELIHVAGMRGGKTTEASIFGSYELFDLLSMGTPWKNYNLLPDSWIYITNLATEEKQAKRTIYAHMTARMDNAPYFEAQNYNAYTMRRIFPDAFVEVHAIPSSAASQVGSTIKCVLFDEVARLNEKRGDDYAWFVYHSLRNGTKTFGMKGIKISISSPVHSADLIMSLYHEAYKPQFPDAPHINPYSIGFMHKTWEMNPYLTRADFNPEFARDPRAAMRDFGCDPRRSEHLYFDDPDILKIKPGLPNLLEYLADGTLSPSDVDDNFTYMAAGDPAYRINAFGIAIGHSVGIMEEEDLASGNFGLDSDYMKDKYPFEGVIIDGLWRFEPSEKPIDPDAICDFFLDMVKYFEINNIGFDTWQYPTIHQKLEQEGVVIHTEQVKKIDWDNMKDLLAMQRLQLCNYPHILEELKHLILNQTETKVIKPRNASKDVADALTHTVKLLIELNTGQPNPWDYYVRTV